MKKESTVVFNLATSEKVYYSLSPKEAVICAYAQFYKKDYNTWNYEKYEKFLIEGKQTIACGDWCALKKGE